LPRFTCTTNSKNGRFPTSPKLMETAVYQRNLTKGNLMANRIVHQPPNGSTGQLKRAIADVFQDATQMAAEISRITAICDGLDIPAVSDDSQPYSLAERVRQLADLAELVLISAVDTSRSQELVRELKRLQQANYVLNNEIKFMRAQEGKPS
jgi:hypothetical protein